MKIILLIFGIVLAVVISGAVYATNFENVGADDINKGIGQTEVWEPGPTDGFTPTEIPARQYQEAQERPSYTEALSNGSIVITSESPKLSDKQLDNVMDELLYSELDRFILPIASIAIDYETDTLVLWTPDLSIGNKVKAVVGDTSFVLLYEEVPPRWLHDGPEPEPKTSSILTINDRLPERTIVPITVTQLTKNAELLDTITNYNFSILGIEMSTLGDYWGNLPDQYITSEMVDQNGNDVLDYTRIPDGMIFYKLSLLYYPAVCEDGQKIKGEGGYPEPIPIKKGASDVFFKSGDIGLYPDDDGKYFFDFVSGFETEIEFPSDVKITSQETKKCDLEIERGNFTDVYYTNVVFNFED